MLLKNSSSKWKASRSPVRWEHDTLTHHEILASHLAITEDIRWSTKRVLCPIGCYHQNKKRQQPEFFKVSQKIKKTIENTGFPRIFGKNRLFFWFFGLPWKIQVFVFFSFGGGIPIRFDIAPVFRFFWNLFRKLFRKIFEKISKTNSIAFYCFCSTRLDIAPVL